MNLQAPQFFEGEVCIVHPDFSAKTIKKPFKIDCEHGQVWKILRFKPIAKLHDEGYFDFDVDLANGSAKENISLTVQFHIMKYSDAEREIKELKTRAKEDIQVVERAHADEMKLKDA